jgi:spermidine synthase
VALFEGAHRVSWSPATNRSWRRARGARLDRRLDIQATLADHRLEELFDDLIASDAELQRLADEHGDGVLSTDDNLYLEYATPKGNVMNYHESLAATQALANIATRRAQLHLAD